MAWIQELEVKEWLWQPKNSHHWPRGQNFSDQRLWQPGNHNPQWLWQPYRKLRQPNQGHWQSKNRKYHWLKGGSLSQKDRLRLPTKSLPHRGLNNPENNWKETKGLCSHTPKHIKVLGNGIPQKCSQSIKEDLDPEDLKSELELDKQIVKFPGIIKETHQGNQPDHSQIDHLPNVYGVPNPDLGLHHLEDKNTPSMEIPYFSRLQENFLWWKKFAPKRVLHLIQEGVHADFPLPNFLDSRIQSKTTQEEVQALQVLEEYMAVGAVIKNPPGVTRHLVPWFVIKKEENGKEKLRLISDCRQLNHFFNPQRFKLDHWKNIFPFLKKGMWAGKIDLKHAYFHLKLAEQLKPFLRMEVAGDIYQFQAACFGLSTLPQIWMEVMKVFQKLWRKRGILCFIYLDDILVINSTSKGVERDIAFMLQTLQDSGMVVNLKKSILKPTQNLTHLGFTINLADGVLEVPKAKLKAVRKELGKILTHPQMSCRKMAAILGNIRSFLMAMPFLRAFTDHMMEFVNQSKKWGWDRVQDIPPYLQQEVRDLNSLTSNWKGRQFLDKVVVRKLHSDSSNTGWAGVDIVTGSIVQEFWREKDGLHINVKELQAAINTVKSLAKTKEVVHLSVDNSVSFAYLNRGGGRLPQFNFMMRDFWRWCMEKELQVRVELIRSEEDQADFWSRAPLDKGDYTMDHNLFNLLAQKMAPFIKPQVDMFASPGNHQLEKFVARYPHWEAITSDALNCSLKNFQQVYANPPWTIILQWLNRLWVNPHITCLMITPYWVGAPWWPLLVKMHSPRTPAFLIPPYNGMFTNCHGKSMRAPRWPLVCTVLSGEHWRANKSVLKTLTLF